MDRHPVLGRAPRRPYRRGTILVAVALGAADGGYWWHRTRAPRAPSAAAPSPTVEAAPARRAPPGDARAPAEEAAASSPVRRALEQAGLGHVRVVLDGALETAIVAETGRAIGRPLTQVVARVLAWWAELPSGLRRGDVVEVLFEERPGGAGATGEPRIAAVRFRGGRDGLARGAYRFRAAGAAHPRLYLPTGEELEVRLRDAPLDGLTHRGALPAAERDAFSAEVRRLDALLDALAPPARAAP